MNKKNNASIGYQGSSRRLVTRDIIKNLACARPNPRPVRLSRKCRGPGPAGPGSCIFVVDDLKAKTHTEVGLVRQQPCLPEKEERGEGEGGAEAPCPTCQTPPPPCHHSLCSPSLLAAITNEHATGWTACPEGHKFHLMQELTQRGLQGPTQRAILFSQTSQTPSPPLSKQPTPPEAWSAEWVEQHPNPDFRKRFNSGAGGTGRVIDASPAGQEISQTPLSFPVGYRAGCSKVGGLPLPLAPSPSPPPYLPCRGLYQHGYGCHGLACRGVQHACCAIMDDDDDGYDGDVEEAHPTVGW
eukprot:1162015-Pelagomonas_calceolata.AAC.14